MKRLLPFFIVLLCLAKANAQTYRNEWIDYSKTYYKFKLHLGFEAGLPKRKGLVRIYQPSLVSAGLGSTLAQDFQLFKDGEEVPMYTSVQTGVLSTTDYIEFWGEINNGNLDNDLYRESAFQLNNVWSLQTDTAFYFLTSNPSGSNKRLVSTNNNVAGTGLTPTEYFMSTTTFAYRSTINPGLAAQTTQPLYSSSYDRGEGLMSRSIRPQTSSCGQRGLALSLTGFKPYLNGPSMTLFFNAAGNANNARTVLVTLNGDTVSNFQMDYRYDAKVVQPGINPNKIASGTALFRFVNQSQVDCDEFKMAQVQVMYPRTLDGNGAKSLELTLPATFDGHYLKFYNFDYGTTPPVLYDLTNGKRYVADLSVADTIQFVTEPFFTSSNFVLVNTENASATNITNFQQRNFINYGDLANQGDYLIISNPLIYGSGSNNFIEQYRQYRSSSTGGGYNAITVDINEITDQFALGVTKHPLAIRNFLTYTRNFFINPPKYVFLIGKGINYKEYRENINDATIEQQNLVPTWGHPASDNLLSAENNMNPTPAIPIGRLNAISASEVGDYLTKVKQYDSIQRAPATSIADKTWMKNVLQVAGANDYTLASQLDGFLNRYKGIIEDSIFGAKAKNYNKIDDPTGYTQSLKDFKSTYETGASIVTYFGHSSSSNLDFSLDNPSAYSNQYRYPIFIVNGCDAGNFFTYDPQRFTTKSTISEKFIFEPQRGAIGYLASTGFGVVNYLDTFTRKFYRNMARTLYNQPFGNVVKQGITDVLASLNSNDFYARIHAEQFTFHGDPALKPNGFDKPDYAVEAQYLSSSPSFISVADDSFYVKLKVFNIGRKTATPVSIKLDRQYPTGTSETVFSGSLPAITSVDSLTVALPILSNRDRGLNNLTVTVDYTNTIDESSESNNTASFAVSINENEIRPIYPYKFSMINNSNFKLVASTANPLAAARNYVMEIDTTALFNSPIKFSQTKNSSGGIIEFDNGITLQNNVTYYWRVAPQTSKPRWNVSSFTYNSTGSTGFKQQHFYQHTESSFNRLTLDSASRKFFYNNKLNNLFVQHSIYPTSGTEDQQFAIQVNGSSIISSACLGQSVIINVFDTLSFSPWENTTNPFGAEPTCAPSRKYNFEYHYIDNDGRESAKQFLQSIPNGYYVAVRLVYDWDNIYATDWAQDSLISGTNTLYHFLKNQGLPIDSFDRPRTFGFIFKKNDATRFSPRYQFTQGVYDRVIMSVDCNLNDTLGYITSPKMGASKTWRRVKWNGTGTSNNLALVDVIGIASNGAESKLYTLSTAQQDVDISSVSATQYPALKLQLKNQDSITAKPYQLSSWSIEYDEAPELAVAPNIYFSMPDTVGGSFGDTLRIGVAYKNVGKVNFTDSLSVRMVIYNEQGVKDTINLPRIRPLAIGDSININTALYVANRYQGQYNIYFIVNPDKILLEQNSFNNFVTKYVYFKTGFVNSNIYYSAATGDLSNSNTWGINPDGSGGRALNFTDKTKTFQFANRNGSFTLTSNLSIAGNVILPSLSVVNLSTSTLSIGDTLQNNGAFIGTGKVVLIGNTRQTLIGNGFINNLELNNTAGAVIATGSSNKIFIQGSYMPTSGLLTTNDNLILYSDASGTGRVGTGNTAGGYITGNVQMQRYIPGGFRKFRFLGHPFNAPMLLAEISDDVDITGAIFGSNSNGFTPTATNSPSSFFFVEGNDDGTMQGSGNNSGWQAYTSGGLASRVQPGQGIRLLIRGSKGQTGSLTGGAYTPNPVTIKLNGVVRQGNFNLPLQYSGVGKGWNLIANPYASNIDWELVGRNNVENAVYTYRPSFNGGVYASYVNGSSTNGGGRIIESTNAFFVKANNTNASLDFHEADKVGTAVANTMFRNASVISNRLLLQLQNDSTQLTDEVVVRFGDDNRATDLFDAALDARNLPGALHDLYVLDTNQTAYSIYHGTALQQPAQEKRAIPLGITTTVKGNYVLKATVLDAFATGQKIYLKDNELGTLTLINDSIKYSFSTNNAANLKQRFSLVFNVAKQVQPLAEINLVVKATPNPVKDRLIITFSGANEAQLTSLRIVNKQGAIMANFDAGKVTQGSYAVSTSTWASGQYIIQLINGEANQIVSVVKVHR
jgi:hypothetical protein